MVKRPNALLIDDRRENLLALQAALKDLDIEIFTSQSAEEGLRILLDNECAVIVLDVEMPGIDGFEMARLVRLRPRCRHTPIIFVTAADRGESLITEGYSLGAVDFLIKPFAPEILRWKVQIFADLYRRSQESLELIREQTIRAESEAAAHRAALLADISAVLMSVDYQNSIERLPDLVVRRMADWACLARCQGDRLGLTIESQANHNSSQPPSSLQWASFDVEQSTMTRLAQGATLFLDDVQGLERNGFKLTKQQQQLLRTIGFYSAMAIPICRQGDLIGVLFLVRTRGPVFSALDVMMAEELAYRIKMGVTNAHLFQAAQNANRAKDEFLAIVSHELRTPLNAIAGWVQILQSKEVDAERTAAALAVIERNAKLQAELISDILDISRVSTGQLSVQFANVELVSIIKRTFEATKPLAESKQIDLECDVEVEAAVVWGDEKRLQQILGNLVSNAIKFTPEKGRVEIRLVRRDSGFEINVRDNGQGIRADLTARIFEPFVQADATQARAHGGLGLGLAIAKQLVQRHGGTIRAESDGEGFGSTFIVTLPSSRLHARAG